MWRTAFSRAASVTTLSLFFARSPSLRADIASGDGGDCFADVDAPIAGAEEKITVVARRMMAAGFDCFYY